MVETPPPSALKPAFVSENSQFVGSFVEESGSPASHYQVLLVDQQDSRRIDIAAATMPPPRNGQDGADPVNGKPLSTVRLCLYASRSYAVKQSTLQRLVF